MPPPHLPGSGGGCSGFRQSKLLRSMCICCCAVASAYSMWLWFDCPACQHKQPVRRVPNTRSQLLVSPETTCAAPLSLSLSLSLSLLHKQLRRDKGWRVGLRRSLPTCRSRASRQLQQTSRARPHPRCSSRPRTPPCSAQPPRPAPRSSQ